MEAVTHRLQHWKTVCLLYIVCAIITTYPMILSPMQTVVGHEQASVACHVWVYWWAQNHAAEIVTPMIFYPYGADVVQLYGSDLLSPVLAYLFPISPVLLYNLWILFLLVMGGMGIRRLVADLGGSWGGAFSGGVLYMTGAFFHHEVLNGTAEIVAASTVVWYLVYLRKVLDAPTLRLGFVLGVWAGVATALSAYNPFFLMIVTLCEMLHRATKDSEPILTSALVKSGVMSMLSFLSFLIPVAWLHLKHGAGDTFSRREDWLSEDSALPDSYAGLFDWFNFSEAQIPAQIAMPHGEIFEYWTTCTVYLGICALGLLFFGIFKNRWTSSLRPFAWMSVVSVLIALGPYLRWGESVLKFGDWVIPLPAQTIAYLFPPFVITAIHAYRYTTVVMLALSVMVGRMTRHWAWGLAFLFELILLSPIPWPVPVTAMPTGEVIEYLQQADNGAVFTAPVARENLHDLGMTLLLQTQHHKAVHEGGIHRRAGKNATQLFNGNPMVDALSGRFGPSFVGDVETLWSIRDILDKGFRYILVPTSELETIQYFSDILGPPPHSDAEWSLWELQ